jgi:transcriptional regulator with XRE-family HTH domain
MTQLYDIGLNDFGEESTSLCTPADMYRRGVSSIDRSFTNRQIALIGVILCTGTLSLTTPLCLKERLGTSNWDFQVTATGSGTREKNLACTNSPVQNLAQIRKVFHPSITELANLFGVSRQAIYDWQAGKGVSNEHAEKVEMLAKAAARIAAAEVPVSQMLRRKLPGGKTLFEIVKDGDSAEVAALKLIDMARRDIEQRRRLEARLSGRKRPLIDRGDIGSPMLSEEE